ncbi:MAG: TrmB family transcriptional regulator [Promethearchaeota archaeon]
MSKDLMEDLKEFLNDANLSTYEINAFTTLLISSKTNPPTARELSSESNVPSGRIYEVLEDLKTKGLIEIIDSRPKKYIATSLNKALERLITFQSDQNKRKIGYLYDRAKILESELYDSDVLLRKEPSRIFWSTTYGTKSILALYVKYIDEAREEIIFNQFINKNTLKVLPFGKIIYDSLKKALDRGVKLKDLWSFEYDERPLTEEEKEENYKIFTQIRDFQEDYFGISSNVSGCDMKFIYNRTLTYYDIFDRKRIIFKLRNPLEPHQIFACMNVVDPSLAEKMREKFLSMWTFEAIEEKD